MCPDEETATGKEMSILTIMSKVRLEAFMWGAGTALGESVFSFESPLIARLKRKYVF